MFAAAASSSGGSFRGLIWGVRGACVALSAGVVVAIIAASCATRSAGPLRSIRIGVDNSPYSRVDAHGHSTGLAVDLINEAAKRRHIKITWVPVTGEDPDAALQSGRVDLWPVLGITSDRLARIHITKPWFQNVFCLVTRRGAASTPDHDVKGRVVSHTN